MNHKYTNIKNASHSQFMKVENKTIIVTGAGNGIGRELTLQLLRKNAKVVGIDINANALNETQKNSQCRG